MYKEVWEAAIGEVLECHREPTNATDRYAVAVTKAATIIGHLPRKLSKVCSLFLRRGGSIRSTVTGRRRYSSDLLQGGLEIPFQFSLYNYFRAKNFRPFSADENIFTTKKKQITVYMTNSLSVV